MGFINDVMAKATDLAADAERAGRVAAAQARLAVLQQDLKKAERELGQDAIALVDRGELSHVELNPAIDNVRAAQAAVAVKEAEIAQMREAGPEPTSTTDQGAATSTAGASAGATADSSPVTAPSVPYTAPESAPAPTEPAASSDDQPPA